MSPLLTDALLAGGTATGVITGLLCGARISRVRTAREVLRWHQEIVRALNGPPAHLLVVLSHMLDRFDYLTLGGKAPVMRDLGDPAGLPDTGTPAPREKP